jgi:hypothetical protein
MNKKPQTLPATRKSTPRATTADQLKAQARERPGMLMAGGLVLGLVAGALLPRGFARNLAKGAAAAVALGGEAGLGLARQVRDRAQIAAGDAAERLQDVEEGATAGVRRLRRSAADAADNASKTATNTGLKMTRAAIRLLGALKR